MNQKNETVKDEKSSKLLMRIVGFVKPFFFLLISVIILNAIFSTLSTLTIAVAKPLFELIFQVQNQADSIQSVVKHGFFDDFNKLLYGNIEKLIYNNSDVYQSLLNFSILIISLFIIKNLFKYFASVAQVRLEEGIVKSIRDKVFSNMTFLSVDFFTKNKEGILLSAITNDSAMLNTATIASMTNSLREIIQVILILLLLLSISPYLTFIAFSTSIIGLLLLKFALKFIKRYAGRMLNAMASYTSAMQETISGIRVVKAYNAEETAIERFKQQTLRYVQSAVKHKKIVTMIPSFNEVFAILALCVVLFIGGKQVLVTKELSSAELMSFIIYLFAIMSPIALTFENISKIQGGLVAAARVFRILDSVPSVKSGNKNCNGFNNKIEVKNVNFAYDETGIIRNADFTIGKSRTIAFVGASGSGKSTMLDLIIRFYDPVSGDILLDGTNIKEFKVESYRSLFGIVGQDTMLFNDSIINNIRYGDSSISFDKITEAAKISNSYDFIMQFPNNFETIVGDRGVMLSGGERQRIAIARALARDPEILVFDEATSALDAESEKVVQDAINKSLKNKTAIIVAHRLATIINCDEIHIFNNGNIIESGTHSELIAKAGIYKKLYDIQFAGNPVI